MESKFDVIIIGGSYAGLSAAMALGRSLRKVLIIDGGKPCNIQTPHSHNFITQDGQTPKQIAEIAKEQVLKYDTVSFYEGNAVDAEKISNGFLIKTENGESFSARKIIFATGLKDQMPEIKGFAECWGISVLHCPYCHGYEVKNQPIGVIANGDIGFDFTRLIYNWSSSLTLFTNGESTLTNEQTEKIKERHIQIVTNEIAEFEHQNGSLKNIVFKDGGRQEIAAVFARAGFKQHSQLPELMGCSINEQGFINVDEFQKTTVPGIYAAGDNTSMFRSVSNAVAAGTKAGAIVNKEIIEEDF